MINSTQSFTIKYFFFFYVENSDITLQQNQLVSFSPISTSRQCFPVDIIPDNFVENSETITLEIQTTNEDINLAPANTIITISDDDCERMGILIVLSIF